MNAEEGALQGEAPQVLSEGYGGPQMAAVAGQLAFFPSGYAPMATYDASMKPTADQMVAMQESPYGGASEGYGYGQQPMYPMSQMMYGGQGGVQGGENMFYAPQMAAAAQPGMGTGTMFNANMMGMGMAPMGMNMSYGQQMNADESKLSEQFGGMSFEDVSGGKGAGGHGRGGGRGGQLGGFSGGFEGGKGKGRGRGFVHGQMGVGMEGRGHGGYGKGGYPNSFEDRGKRDEERDRERARNGVRGLRSGGYMNPMGPPMHTPEVMRLKETINPPEFEIAPKYARFFVIKSYSEDDVHKSIKCGPSRRACSDPKRFDAILFSLSARFPCLKD